MAGRWLVVQGPASLLARLDLALRFYDAYYGTVPARIAVNPLQYMLLQGIVEDRGVEIEVLSSRRVLKKDLWLPLPDPEVVLRRGQVVEWGNVEYGVIVNISQNGMFAFVKKQYETGSKRRQKQYETVDAQSLRPVYNLEALSYANL